MPGRQRKRCRGGLAAPWAASCRLVNADDVRGNSSAPADLTRPLSRRAAHWLGLLTGWLSASINAKYVFYRELDLRNISFLLVGDIYRYLCFVHRGQLRPWDVNMRKVRATFLQHVNLHPHVFSLHRDDAASAPRIGVVVLRPPSLIQLHFDKLAHAVLLARIALPHFPQCAVVNPTIPVAAIALVVDEGCSDDETMPRMACRREASRYGVNRHWLEASQKETQGGNPPDPPDTVRLNLIAGRPRSHGRCPATPQRTLARVVHLVQPHDGYRPPVLGLEVVANAIIVHLGAAVRQVKVQGKCFDNMLPDLATRAHERS